MKRREMYAAFVVALIAGEWSDDRNGKFCPSNIAAAANDLCDLYRPERINSRNPKTGRFARATAGEHADFEKERVKEKYEAARGMTSERASRSSWGPFGMFGQKEGSADV